MRTIMEPQSQQPPCGDDYDWLCAVCGREEKQC